MASVATRSTIAETRGVAVGHFLYPRHFLLLIWFGILSAVLRRPYLPSDLSVSFALYGALHAAALVLALRASRPIWQKSLFIASAAGLCIITFRIGMFARGWLETLPGHLGLYTALGFSAVLGALAYGISIHLFGFIAMTSGSIAAISFGCMLATFVAVFTGPHFHFLGPWWLAVLWWYAFSAGLWYFDQREHRAAQAPDPAY
jgi:hypothetical protein